MGTIVGYIAYRGVTGATSVNIAINVIQISALVVFSVIAIAYRVNHGTEGSKGITLNPDGVPVSKIIAMQTTKATTSPIRLKIKMGITFSKRMRTAPTKTSP